MRGKKAPRRVIAPDPKYGSVTLAKFTNYLMSDGKKATAQAIVYEAFALVAERSSRDPLEIFSNAMKNVSPAMEVRSKRVGGANYQVPFPVRGDRKQSLAFRWLLGATRARKGKPMALRLADELLAASQGDGAAVKKRQDVQRMAESNRAFAHFAW
ncbi:MAG: 30S ribosomal protein S7 [bacterium]|nr:30S ribosomal protein S7 [bacterium]